MKFCPEELRVVGWDHMPGEKGPESGGGGGLGQKCHIRYLERVKTERGKKSHCSRDLQEWRSFLPLKRLCPGRDA